MEELIKQVSERAGISEEQARAAVETVAAFLKERVPAPYNSYVDGFLSGESGGGLLGSLGGMFGGRNDRPVKTVGAQEARFDNEDESRFTGQVGGGLEFRITPHCGVMGDFSWNFLDGPHNDFGMVRSGINFAC